MWVSTLSQAASWCWKALISTWVQVCFDPSFFIPLWHPGMKSKHTPTILLSEQQSKDLELNVCRRKSAQSMRDKIVLAGRHIKHSALSLMLLSMLTACDSDNNAEQTVAQENRPPTVSSIPPVKLLAGQTKAIAVQGNDQDGDPLTYSLIDSPAWATINQQDGILTLSPSREDDGKHQLQVQVSDRLLSVQTTVDVNVVLPASSLTPAVCRGGSYTPALCQALASGDHTVVSEAELLDFTENTIKALADKQASVIDHLFAGTGPEYSYTTAKSDMYVMDIQSPEDTFVALLANKQRGSDNIRKITGVLAERNGQRIGLFAQNGFDVNASEQVNTYHKNLVHWLTGGKTEDLSIVLSHQMWKDLMPHQKTMTWFNEHFPTSTFNNIQTCDFENLAV